MPFSDKNGAKYEGVNLYRVFFEAAFDAFFVLDLDESGDQFYIKLANSRALKVFGCERPEQFIGKTVFDFSPDKQFCGTPSAEKGSTFFQKAIGGEPQNFEWLHNKLDGTPFLVEVSLSRTFVGDHPVGIVALRDISERKEMERENAALQSQLFQSQRLESLGTLAGGIAHDFNNILMVISGFTELAREQLPEDHDVHLELETVSTACQRASDLVKRILAFSRESSTTRKATAIQPIIQESVDMLRATLPASIIFDMQLDAPDVYVLMDPIEMQQVVTNLCTNASHAIGEDHGFVTVSLKEETQGSSQESTFLKLVIEDNGAGIGPDILPNVFDPFFTTKPVGKGTGLGLSMVHGIIQGLGGEITITSNLGQGTKVAITLPVCSKPAEEKVKERKTGDCGGERIIIVDDEPDSVRFLTQALSKLGYEVFPATSGAEAFHLIKKNNQTVDLLLTDATMPNTSGIELIRLAREECPGLPVILFTGKLTDQIARKAELVGVDLILHKPTTINDLADAVRAVLDRAVEDVKGSTL